MPDMSPEEKALVRDDCQRAAALVVHHSRNDADGFNVCLQEAVAADLRLSCTSPSSTCTRRCCPSCALR
jgi:hypothetical protein